MYPLPEFLASGVQEAVLEGVVITHVGSPNLRTEWTGYKTRSLEMEVTFQMVFLFW
jgi:hypothetical protein